MNKPNLTLGNIIKLKRPCMNSPAGSIGYVYETYSIGADHPGVSVIFENGDYDGFSKNDQDYCLDYLYSSPFLYNFHTVIQLIRDYRNGAFNDAFRGGKHFLELEGKENDTRT